eukprot:CAMPEP_0194443712 /NCGR_PEP_ID=MMETSP0176-20130528/126864_1 /TAXON_ID=216777 /ORGANISM="Proboscia alata, Strain PI-D3" /LENGTH=744 /DNA_ID=CAMNT_0039270001 /DNA_START=149 /DNA_END=2383 /DNA_ORIENTATION=-
MNAVSNANELNSITNLRQYILACPRNVVSNKSSSKVLKTVLQVLDELQTKLERDEKLRRKFAKAAAALTTIKRSSIGNTDSADIPSSSSVASPDVANTEAATVSSSICAMDEDWQDVHMTEQLSLHPVKIIFDKIQEQPVEKLPVSESSLGQRLASKSITLIAVQGTHIRKPDSIIVLKDKTKPQTMSTRSGRNRESSNEHELTDIKNLRQYILACPSDIVTNVSSSKVVKTVLQALDESQTKLERDEKLRRKFAKASALTTTESSPKVAEEALLLSSLVSTIKGKHIKGTITVSSDCAMEEDWHYVPMEDPSLKTDVDNMQEHQQAESSLGQRLASKSITLIAVQGTHIRKPVAGIAVALHATLVLLEFKCTGVWKEETSEGGGFAAPIRELPHTQFLPLNWDNQQGGDTVRLRYRKDGISGGNLHLKCTQFIDATDTRMIEVEFHPSGSRVECQNSVLFPMEEHFNLASLQVALAKSMDGSVSPALHYKSLASLLAQFVETFDVGAIPNSVERDDQSEIEALATDSMIQINTNDADDTIADAPVVLSMSNLIEKSRLVKDTQVERSRLAAFVNGPQINDMLKDILNPEPVQPARSDGDFSTDLHPSIGISIGGTNIDPLTGFAAPSRGGLNTGQTGNLMGPTHPMFMNPNHNNDDEVGNGGGLMLPTRGGGISMGGQGFGMVPRHDPLYPPGVMDPSDLHGGRGRGGGRGGRSGRGLNRDLRGPNPDHQRPPNDFSGGGMFL